MPTLAFVNGRFTSPEEAKLSALDAGFQHAVGIFTTMLGGCASPRSEPVNTADEAPIEGIWVADLDDHLDRLVISAMELGLAQELNASGLAEAVVQTVARSNLRRARIRLTITGGDLNLLNRDPKSASPIPRTPTVLIVAQPATSYPAAMLQNGVGATLATTRANTFDRFTAHKTLNYWWRLAELQSAARRNAGESLVFDIAGRLVGGCVSNAFIVKGEHVYTPPSSRDEPDAQLPSVTLAGITRQWAIHELAGRGSIVQKRHLTPDDVLSADELFLTNSSWGVLPVVQLESRTIGSGKPGAVTTDLIARWSRHIAALAGEPG